MNEILFSKNKDLFDQRLSTGITFTPDTDISVVEAIFSSQVVKDLSLPIQLLDGQVKANTNDDKFRFVKDPGGVYRSASAPRCS